MQSRDPYSIRSRPQPLSRRGLIQSAAAWVHFGALGLGTFNSLSSSRVDASSSRVDAGTTSSMPAAKSKPAKSCILLWLDGGPSHLEMFDPKPEAPVEVRGDYQAIATNVPGIRIGEWLPRTSAVCDKLAILRSVTSPLGEHGLANRYLLTGYKPAAVEYPCYGSVLQHLRGQPGQLPSHIAIPEIRSVGSGFLGSHAEPFATGGDPAQAGFQVRDLALPKPITLERLDRRHRFLQRLESDFTNHSENGEAIPPAMREAFALMQSPSTQQAFNLSQEPQKTRERYGLRTFGQSCLLARRLVQQGVSFVTVQYPGWDTHENLRLSLRDGYSGAKEGVGLIPTFDQAYSALIEDLDQSGLLDETLVVVMGEFGRTPKLNTRGGRDHWPRVFSVVMAGGGIRGGQTVGESDRIGESPRSHPITPADLAYSIYRLLGVDPDQELNTPEGRPIPLVQGGKWIPQLT
ncbi:hypothetical protein VN12_14940 [Pirellula sp. SH-Sr6A]|uniref:DUF1501 domain-containing protein n=1 Tax=Pirellula sp. SH-Sr6A TaxID=1632865 RepID=UPI00078CA506|nr:DUF1501 domain-containing protein [Pirellula sp. SH-Sr6A]AMV33420.1 hypothetical protein VN12_14940 [Pirellula sp. SH-Sr6A]